LLLEIVYRSKGSVNSFQAILDKIMLYVTTLICVQNGIFLYEYSHMPPFFYTFGMENKNSLMKCILFEYFCNWKKNANILYYISDK